MKDGVKPVMKRPYRLDRRSASAQGTRNRIVQAARKLLVSPGGITNFTIDAVAKKARVGRMTLYYHFRSRIGLIEAIADTLELHVHKSDLAECLETADFPAGLDKFIAMFGDYYWKDRQVIRKLNALYTLDPGVTKFVDERQAGRREMLRRAFLRAYPEMEGADATVEDIIATLFTFTKFEFYDPLAGENRAFADIVPLIQRLARAVLEWRHRS